MPIEHRFLNKLKMRGRWQIVFFLSLCLTPAVGLNLAGLYIHAVP